MRCARRLGIDFLATCAAPLEDAIPMRFVMHAPGARALEVRPGCAGQNALPEPLCHVLRPLLVLALFLSLSAAPWGHGVVAPPLRPRLSFWGLGINSV